MTEEYPNWWGTLPQPVFTFLEEYDFSGKTIWPLCTHEGSRLGSSESDIARLAPNAELSEGLEIRGSVAGSSQAEAGKSVSDYLGNSERITDINVMNRLSVDCDCDGNPAEPDMHDIGILASTDAVALDQACISMFQKKWVPFEECYFEVRRIMERCELCFDM